MKKKIEIKEIDALRAAKLAFVLSTILALLCFVLVQLSLWLAVGAISSELGGEFTANYSEQSYLHSLITIAPIILIGWVAALVVCFAYNILARLFGGFIVTVEDESGGR
jgi:hypothetical protein